jgi:ABC-type sugar transport system ATPase subunit
LISHNLANVFEVADRITVLRLGRWVGTYDAKATGREQLVGFMTGAVPGTAEPPPPAVGPAAPTETP